MSIIDDFVVAYEDVEGVPDAIVGGFNIAFKTIDNPNIDDFAKGMVIRYTIQEYSERIYAYTNYERDVAQIGEFVDKINNMIDSYNIKCYKYELG